MSHVKFGKLHCPLSLNLLFLMSPLKAWLHYGTELNLTVVGDKEQGPKTIQSLGLGLEYTKTAVALRPSYTIRLNSTVELSLISSVLPPVYDLGRAVGI